MQTKCLLEKLQFSPNHYRLIYVQRYVKLTNKPRDRANRSSV